MVNELPDTKERRLIKSRLLPFSAIVTPGTVSVRLVSRSMPGTFKIPQRAYTSIHEYCGISGDQDSTTYGMAATALLTAGFSTMMSGNILPVRTSKTNLSYALDFTGPAISCEESGEALKQFVQPAIVEYSENMASQVVYYSWVPQPDFNDSIDGSFFAAPDTAGGNVRLDVVSTDAARLYISLNTSGIGASSARVPTTYAPRVHLLTCSLYNASYHVNFELSSSGSQVVTVNTKHIDWVPALSTMRGAQNDPAVIQRMNFQSLMDVFGLLMQGQVYYPYGFDGGDQSVDSSFATSMSAFLWPPVDGLSPDQIAQSYMHKVEIFFQNITLSMRYGLITGWVLLPYF